MCWALPAMFLQCLVYVCACVHVCVSVCRCARVHLWASTGVLASGCRHQRVGGILLPRESFPPLCAHIPSVKRDVLQSP